MLSVPMLYLLSTYVCTYVVHVVCIIWICTVLSIKLYVLCILCVPCVLCVLYVLCVDVYSLLFSLNASSSVSLHTHLCPPSSGVRSIKRHVHKQKQKSLTRQRLLSATRRRTHSGVCCTTVFNCEIVGSLVGNLADVGVLVHQGSTVVCVLYCHSGMVGANWGRPSQYRPAPREFCSSGHSQTP